jgi:hypothetical protein
MRKLNALEVAGYKNIDTGIAKIAMVACSQNVHFMWRVDCGRIR